MKLKSTYGVQTCPLCLIAMALLSTWSPPVTAGAASDASTRLVRFDIKTERLDTALLQFAEQAHVQLALENSRQFGTIQATELKGNYTETQALLKLLDGRPFSFEEHGHTVTVTASPTRAPDRQWPPVRATGPDRGPTSESSPAASLGSQPESAPTKQAAGPTTESGAARETRGEGQLSTIIVTGTHIAGAPSSSPVIELTRDEIDRSGYSTVGQLIRSLPENFNNASPETIIGSAPNANDSPSGASAPNLFGLGPESTLTLINGQRLAEDSVTGAVDISLVPLPVIERIEVLTGGASSIYGSDAVAGVVNIVLKRDFNGVRTSLLGSGTSDGGASDRGANEMIGKRWRTGGALIDYEYEKQGAVYAHERSYTRSAGSITTPIPATSRNSFFVTAHQEFGPISAFADGLYTHRMVHDAYSNGTAYPSETEAVDVHQYAASGGVDGQLPDGWAVSAIGDFSEQRSVQAFALVPSGPSPIPPLAFEGQSRSVEATANGPVLRAPTGRIRAAIGAGYRWETYNQDQGARSELPGARGRAVKYGYGELAVPLVRQSEIDWRRSLTLNISGRFEHYSDFGSESVPKLGLVYIPFAGIKIRGTWGKAFRAPTLYQMYSVEGLLYTPLPDPTSRTRVSNALLTLGGNRALKPETARTWTLGVDYESNAMPGLRASVSYFEIQYRSRIGRLANSYTALTDPLNAPFVIRNPSPVYVQGLINQAGFIVNRTAVPLEASTVQTVIEDGDVNVSSQDASGVTVGLNYRKVLPVGVVSPFANCALLDLRQRLVPGASDVEISGRVFEPAKVRARGGVSWSNGPWVLTGTVNYTGPESNTYQPGAPPVASWTTVDFSALLKPKFARIDGRLGLALSVENAFNRDPPYVQFDQVVPGIHYDPLNANALGRAIRASISWTFD